MSSETKQRRVVPKPENSFSYPTTTTTPAVNLNNDSKSIRSKRKEEAFTSAFRILISIILLLFVGLIYYGFVHRARQIEINNDIMKQNLVLEKNFLANSGAANGSMLRKMKTAKNEYNYSNLPLYPNDLYPIQDTLIISFASNHSTITTTSPLSIRIILRPDFSKESVEYIKAITLKGYCKRCSFFRSEKAGILQGIVSSIHPSIVPLTSIKGSCPTGYGYELVPNDCPKWDPQCSCHGPVMTKGTVGFAAGGTGPDFFINNHDKPALFWGTQHTVWGHIVDPKSFLVVNDILHNYPTTHSNGMTYLTTPIPFQLSLESKHL
jgi:cyclophilin family peptidyl-prolyl cis-trans isomerase